MNVFNIHIYIRLLETVLSRQKLITTTDPPKNKPRKMGDIIKHEIYIKRIIFFYYSFINLFNLVFI